MKPKLTFFSFTGNAFLKDIIRDLRKDYDVHFFFSGSQQEFRARLHNTDIAWFEFADQVALEGTKPPKLCKYICRFHSYELFTDFPNKIEWDKIDHTIFVNPVVQDYALQKFKNMRPEKTSVIYNGIDGKKFKVGKKSYNKKVAFIGYINYKKGPELLLQTFNAIYRHDKEFTFHIAGQYQDERIYLYFQNMLSKLPFHISFDNWVEPDKMPEYLSDKDYVISTSLFESFQYSIAEGMASGCVPLIHSWAGSDILYPREYNFVTTDDCVDIIKRFEKSTNKDEIRGMLKAYITNRFSLERQLSLIRKTIKEL